ncbi:MAG: DAK2 domain-containing protein [Actinomycetota bacterium]|nr:DAK2 domain-containing protein [Actinomycetota bacterium]
MIIKLESSDIKKATSIIVDHFKSNEAKINNLNVFPVPDGDTGTNMLLTLKSIKKELVKLKNNDMRAIGEAVSFGGLMGARGNSGVILSQIVKGFFDELKKNDSFNLDILENALNAARDLAYSSVQNPTEGTMLTIIKDLYNHIKTYNENNNDNVFLSDLIDSIISETEKSLIRTTFLLPVLKEANVVDAGAQGILEILIGLKKALLDLGKIDSSLKGSNGEKDNLSPQDKKDKTETVEQKQPIYADKELKELNVSSDIKNIYCTEFIITGQRINLARLREDIESYGDSAMVVGNENLIKIHVHTNHPHRVLGRALREGIIHEVQINNMVDQHMEKMKTAPAVEKPVISYGLISVSNGDGLEEIFKSLGVDIVIKGGQTMNPSTYEIVKAIKKLESEKVIIFPNNKNIILTANQAAKIARRDVVVIPTKTIPQGINAVLNFNRDLVMEDNLNNMEEAYTRVKSGEVTVAVREANLLVGKIKKGQFIGLFDGKIKVISDNVIGATIELIKDMVDEKDSIISFYTGKDSSEIENDKIKDEIKKNYPDIEIEFYKGDQPFYNYIFSVE